VGRGRDDHLVTKVFEYRIRFKNIVLVITGDCTKKEKYFKDLDV
jgi:hypothetical protein